MDLLHLIILVAAGIAAGFINTLAGGGSLLTLPALMLLGMPADIANGTNRVGVLLQSVAAIREFDGHALMDRQALWPILAPTLLGSLLGAGVASLLPAQVLKPALLTTLIAMTLLILLKPSLIPPGGTQARRLQDTPSAWVALFGTGLYGGFAQAGVGFLLIGALAGTLRYDLLRANALKMACTGIFGAASLAVFAWQGQVQWWPGLVLGLATIVGVKLSVRYAMTVRQETLKRWLLGMCLLVCAAAWWR